MDNITDSSSRKTVKVAHVGTLSNAIRGMFEDADVGLHPSSSLARLLAKAVRVADQFGDDKENVLVDDDFFSVLQVDRLAQAILPLVEEQDKVTYLKRLNNAELDFFERIESPAKDIFWELELWSILRKKHSATFLKDPPDIVMDFAEGTLGIACKKLYTEKNVARVLSNAVKQVEGNFDVGVVAFNVDDLISGRGEILSSPTKAGVDDLLRAFNQDFLACNERHFKKYLSAGRLIAAAVTVNVAADILDWKVRLNNVRQTTYWTISGLPANKKALLDKFRDVVHQ